ncbi:expressed unknown protein [Seminavis robusta]|uniref:Uncharacterized protein n=1 Tax=Seminavis robusta TaxID=568900 RepID=A0A9N8HBZ5_9STRA|nr:expressed unknown protein [Seminavis robusta]|eukprot:Sro201_g085030.1 n/a (91) ;mRNA; f:34190-34462
MRVERRSTEFKETVEIERETIQGSTKKTRDESLGQMHVIVYTNHNGDRIVREVPYCCQERDCMEQRPSSPLSDSQHSSQPRRVATAMILG